MRLRPAPRDWWAQKKGRSLTPAAERWGGGWAGNPARVEEAAAAGAMAVSSTRLCEVGTDPGEEKREELRGTGRVTPPRAARTRPHPSWSGARRGRGSAGVKGSRQADPPVPSVFWSGKEADNPDCSFLGLSGGRQCPLLTLQPGHDGECRLAARALRLGLLCPSSSHSSSCEPQSNMVRGQLGDSWAVSRQITLWLLSVTLTPGELAAGL